MNTRRVYRFSYLIHPRGRTRLHLLRDGDAYGELAPLLCASGYNYGGLILNSQVAEEERKDQVDSHLLSPEDLLVLNTRPPLDDEKGEDRRQIKRTGFRLEVETLDRLRPCFTVCTRSQVKLAGDLAVQLPKEYEDRADVRFRMYRGATYHEMRRNGEAYPWHKAGKPPRTAGFLILFPSTAKRHGLLTAFSAGGNETLIFAYLLRKRLWKELKIDTRKPRFVMVEIYPQAIPEQPVDLGFAEDWRTEILLNTSKFKAADTFKASRRSGRRRSA